MRHILQGLRASAETAAPRSSTTSDRVRQWPSGRHAEDRPTTACEEVEAIETIDFGAPTHKGSSYGLAPLFGLDGVTYYADMF